LRQDTSRGAQNELRVAVTSQIGRFFDGGSSGTAFATSTNGGSTFTSGALYVPTGGVNATSFPNPMVKAKAFSDNGANHANTRPVTHRAHKAK